MRIRSATSLKLIADLGLIGLPNAGKSTLLSRLSAARPKIADYPFTTREPYLGVMRSADDEFRTMVVADIPGLIEGAHEGAGLGIQFLRHVERCSVLVHLVDRSPAEGSAAGDLQTVETELAAFDPDLMTRPRVIVGSKLDAARTERRTALAAAAGARGLAYLELSAATGAGVRALVADHLPIESGIQKTVTPTGG